MGKSRTGFHPVGTLNGSPYQGRIRAFGWGGAFTVNIGDLVVLDTNGLANKLPAALGTVANILGVVVGTARATPQDLSSTTMSLNGTTSTLNLEKKALSSAGTVYVTVGKDVVYLAQTNFGARSAIDIGNTANVVAAAPADPTPSNIGMSGMELDGKSIGQSAAALVKIIGIPKDPDRYGNTVLCVLNKTVFDEQTAGI